MSHEDILTEWERLIPKEVRRRDVENVVDNIFQKHSWDSGGSKMKITDDRLLFYKRHVNPQDNKVAFDGSFKIPTVKGRKVKGYYVKRILYMKEIVELVDRRIN